MLLPFRPQTILLAIAVIAVSFYASLKAMDWLSPRARTAAPVVASGGVSSLADLRAIAALVALGVEGAIVGTALYEGAFTLEQALAEVAT